MSEPFPFLTEVAATPPPFDPPRAKDALSDLEKAASRAGGRELQQGVKRLLKNRTAKALVTGVFGNSPYLTGLALRRPAYFLSLFENTSEASWEAVMAETTSRARAAGDIAALMEGLREMKARAALMIALADVANAWGLTQVTGALTRFADLCVEETIRWLLLEAAGRGAFMPKDVDNPIAGSGLIILAMGKYGAYELNYSSDIDIIVFFDAERLPITDKVLPQAFCVKLVQQLIRIMQEGTEHGYVFRVDLRLRPDAGATQVAISLEAAEVYYESFGQNWERAAMIKARPCAGDPEAGQDFMDMIRPFVWRRYLDFAAIEDVHSLKRQIHDKVGHDTITVTGHNIKLGRGGIREIEFFVQTQQLILGGRDPSLRERTTLGALTALRKRGLIDTQAEEQLSNAYVFLRTLEHRIQMVNDHQTHAVPRSHAGVHQTARFMGFKKTDQFSDYLLATLHQVTKHYSALFEGEPPLAEEAGNLVFTGVDDDPDTLNTLKELGYERPSDAAALIRGWHHGRVRAMRSSRARELLTKLIPAILRAFANTSSPDLGLARFDDFLRGLPAGVQMFSLLSNNPWLLDFLARVLGVAPRLSSYLAHNSGVFDALLDEDYLKERPSIDELRAGLSAVVSRTETYEGTLDTIRRWAKEQSFRIGAQVLLGTAEADTAGPAYTDLADMLVEAIQPVALEELSHTHGLVPGGDMAIIALGKFGGREMTATSDLDLIFVYDHDHAFATSDGPQPIHGTQYFSRLAQRIIAGLSAPTAEGVLYEVDMRLRPSGKSGPIAVRLDGLEHYHATEAWTWERMALTRGRVITGGASLRPSLEQAIGRVLCAERDPGETVRDMLDMRERIAREHPHPDIWTIKHVHGRLIDLEFLAQILQLVHASAHPEVLSTSTREAFARMKAAGLIRAEDADELMAATRLYHNLTQVLRIAFEGSFAPGRAAPGLRALLARAAGAASFAETEERLARTQARVSTIFNAVVKDLV